MSEIRENEPLYDGRDGSVEDDTGEAYIAACDATREVDRCACGRELDENGEHPGGYGAWCG